MRRNGALIAGILAGMASPGTLGAVEYPRPQGSDVNRMRGDVHRVGRDFHAVIERENGKQKPAGKGSAKA